jgi:hypothetical protein
MTDIKELFGKPKEGIHEATIPVVNLAAFDVIGTIFIAAGVSYYLDAPFAPCFIGTFVVGEVAHLAFGVETRFIKMIKDKN